MDPVIAASLSAEPPAAGPIPDLILPEDDPAFQVFIDSLSYLPPEEIERVREAYLFSEQRIVGRSACRVNPTSRIPWLWPAPSPNGKWMSRAWWRRSCMT